MADKELTESDWKAFAVKNGVKETALSKCLAALAKAERQGLEQEGDALDEVGKQTGLLIKEHKGNKPVVRRLEDMSDAAAKRWQAVDKALQQAAKEDEEADSPALLTSKMIPLLRELRQGEVTMNALVTTAGKNTAVLIMRRAISPSRRKVMLEAVDAQGGAKHINCTCVFENGALSFVVDTPVSGLAKRVRAALLEQTGMRVKVQLRDPNGATEVDGEDEAEVEAEKGGAQGGEQGEAQVEAQGGAAVFAKRRAALEASVLAALKAQHPEATKIRASLGFADEKAAKGDHASAQKALDMIERLLATAAPAGTATATATAPATRSEGADPASAFNARLAALLPRVKDAVSAALPAAADVRLKVSEAGVLARKKEFGAAQALLDEVEKLLSAGAAATPAGPAAPGAPPPDAGPPAALAQWQSARLAAIAQLKALQGKISSSKHPRATAAVILVRAIQANLSAKPGTLGQVQELERYLENDDIVTEAERPNGFGVKVELRKPLLAALAALKKELAA